MKEKKAQKAKAVTKVKKTRKVKKATKTTKAKKPLKVKKEQKGKKEQKIGVVDHFFSNLNVIAVKLGGKLKINETIHIKGHTTDFEQKVESMQIEHASVEEAKKGNDVGIKVKEQAREHDIIYLVK